MSNRIAELEKELSELKEKARSERHAKHLATIGTLFHDASLEDLREFRDVLNECIAAAAQSDAIDDE